MTVKQFSAEFTEFMIAMGYEHSSNGALRGGGGWWHPYYRFTIDFHEVTAEKAVKRYTDAVTKKVLEHHQYAVRNALLPLMGLNVGRIRDDIYTEVVYDNLG